MFLFVCKNRLAFRIVREKLFRNKRIGLMRTTVVNGALPGVKTFFQRDSMTRTGFDAFTAAVAESLRYIKTDFGLFIPVRLQSA